MAFEKFKKQLDQKTKKTKPSGKVLQENILEDMDNFGLTKELVEEAQKKAKNKITVKEFGDLQKQNPELAFIIKQVALYFEVSEPILYAVFDHESDFKHGLVGHPHKGNHPKGIGQFLPDTWSDLQTKSYYKKFRKFVDKFYPGQKIDRGQNLLVDVAASAAFLKYKGGSRTKFHNLSDHRVVYLRARYAFGSKVFAKKQRDLVLEGKIDEVEPKLTKFLETYHRYKRSYDDRKLASIPAK
jgi:hypothetical protein